MRIAPQVKILRYSDPDRLSLAKAAAIFLGKEDVDNVKRPLTFLYHVPPHKSIFKGEHVRFEFVTSKVAYDHLATYSTANLRACAGLRANRAGAFVTPLELVDTPLEPLVEQLGAQHLNDYNALADGVDPETKDPVQRARLQAARAIAPTSVNLHYIFEFNFLTLMESLFVQRIFAPGAQADTNEVVNLMWELTRACDPELWDAAYDVFGPEALAWQKLRFTLKKKGVNVAELADLIDEIPHYNNPEPWKEGLVSFLLTKYGGRLKSIWK